MKNLEKILNLLFRRVSVKSVIEGKISCSDFSREQFVRLSFAYEDKYSEPELSNMWMYYKDIFSSGMRNQGRNAQDGFPVFESLFHYVNSILLIQNNEILCKYKELLRWREVTFELSEDLLVSAYWAANKKESEMNEIGFTWCTVIGHNNFQLNQIMKRGISENHFHLYGSAPIFHISWLSLMNNVMNSKFADKLKKYDLERRYANIHYNVDYGEESLLIQYYQAAFIRVFLFSEATDRLIRIGSYYVHLEDFIASMDVPNLKIGTGRLEVKELNVGIIKSVLANGDTWKNLWNVLLEVLKRQKLISENDLISKKFEKSNESLYLLTAEVFPSYKSQVNMSAYTDGQYISLIEFLKGMMDQVDLEKLKPFMSRKIYLKRWKEITFNNVRTIIKQPYLLEENLPTLQNIIEAYRNSYSVERVSIKALEDYALLGINDKYYGLDEYNDVFSGERWFLYIWLNNIWRGKESPQYANLFYAYVLIKETLRSELIQSNKKVGFMNFLKYQDRKSELIDDSVFSNEIVKFALHENLLKKNIRSLEIRITPKNSIQENLEFIKQLDDTIGEPIDKYFYTVHFTKESDYKDYKDDFVQCRNYLVRKRTKKKAKALIGLREYYPQCAKRILGIDAAANEIGCRPEVFGSVCRYLRNHMKTIDDGLNRVQVPQLKVTYHVGEEFLDLADGLRAIDEAVNFLNMECGDRLGHAIALGIDVEQWYESKDNRILISKQDYLDNLVWMYNRLIQFDIKGMDSLKNYIEKKYSYYFHEIYAKNMDYRVINHILEQARKKYHEVGIPQTFINDKYSFDIFQYYAAWKIRGDEPSLYEHGYFLCEEEDFSLKHYYVNEKFPKEFEIRYIPEVFILNYYYHFNNKIRMEGNKRIEILVKPMYVQGVKAIQKEMQKRIAQRGLAIETNPSSNYLISTFKHYGKHPIFRLYNKEIAKENADCMDIPQLSVSVNTDDLGVFSTSLENEYALLACALENELDINGRPVYNKSEIYDWIDAVRRMGNEQSFQESHSNHRNKQSGSDTQESKDQEKLNQDG